MGWGHETDRTDRIRIVMFETERGCGIPNRGVEFVFGGGVCVCVCGGGGGGFVLRVEK